MVCSLFTDNYDANFVEINTQADEQAFNIVTFTLTWI